MEPNADRLPGGGVVVAHLFVAHLVLGVALLAVGATFMLRRQRLARREASRGRMIMGTTGWTVLGGICTLVGVVQVVLAFA